MKRVPVFFALVLFAVAAAGQTTSHSDYYSAEDTQAKLSTLIGQAQATGRASDKLFDAGTHSLALSVRTKSGGGEAHAHYDDIIIVVDGAATELTGGSVVDAQTGADGETLGSSVAGGHAQAIATGDVIHILAGTAHQMLLAPGGSIRYFVVKIREN